MYSGDYFIKRSWVEINIPQLIGNYQTIQASLPNGTQIMGVVKADAYGHGDGVVARALEKAGMKLFAVSNLNEGISLRKAGISSEILVLGYTPGDMAEAIYEYDLTQTILSEEYADELRKHTTSRLKCQYAIDTGMNRIGLKATDTSACSAAIRKAFDDFELTGLFTHLSVADSCSCDDIVFTERQMNAFLNVVEAVADLELPYIHCLNSSGALIYRSSINPKLSKIARLGITLYGLSPDGSSCLPAGVLPVLSWKTVVSMVKTVKSGESIGYGRSYIAKRDIRVATLPTGYADGYNRALSNKGYVIVRGQRAPIIGKICMDQMMIDVTEITDAAIGDEVVLIGCDGGETISAYDIGKQIGTIGYEVLCGISTRVCRFYK